MNYINISKLTIITTIFIIQPISCPATISSLFDQYPHAPSTIMRQRPEVPKSRPLTLVQRTEQLKQKVAHLKQNLMEIYLDMFNAIDEIFEINNSLSTRLSKVEEKSPLHPPLKSPARDKLTTRHTLPTLDNQVDHLPTDHP